MSAKRGSTVIANSNNKQKSLKSCSKPFISRNCKLIITPLEHSPLKNMYFSLLNSQGKSAPNTLNVLNLNHSNVPINTMDTITLVDINEIKNRPLEVPRNKRKVAKIKPVFQNHYKQEPAPANISTEAITKFEKRFFLSYVSLETINFRKYKRLSPFTYKIKTDNGWETLTKSPNHNQHKKISFAIPLVNKTLTPKRPLAAFSPRRPIIHKRAHKFYEPKFSFDNKFDETYSKSYKLSLNAVDTEEFVDPYEPSNKKAFSFETIAYSIANTENSVKLPSHQWCCSLREDVIYTKDSKERAIIKFCKRGELKMKTLYYEDNIIRKKVSSFLEITKMKHFNFRRYQLCYSNGKVVTEPDRCVTILRSGDYEINFRGQPVKLCAAPEKVRNIRDIEILLDIIDRVKSEDGLILFYE